MLLRDKRQPIKKPFLASLLRLEGMASKKTSRCFWKNLGTFLYFPREVFLKASPKDEWFCDLVHHPSLIIQSVTVRWLLSKLMHANLNILIRISIESRGKERLSESSWTTQKDIRHSFFSEINDVLRLIHLEIMPPLESSRKSEFRPDIYLRFLPYFPCFAFSRR